MQLTIISDTHNRHEEVILTGGEVLIHAGDFSGRGTKRECIEFLTWFNEQAYNHKILIAGNHDFFFERGSKEEIEAILPKGIHYLQNSSVVIENVKFYGSPATPYFHNWAFNYQRGQEINQVWDNIPDDTQVLITHGPPFGILDKTTRGEHVGCEELLKKINKIQPRLHVFGHIHECFGRKICKGTEFVNASLLDDKYLYVNDVCVIEI